MEAEELAAPPPTSSSLLQEVNYLEQSWRALPGSEDGGELTSRPTLKQPRPRTGVRTWRATTFTRSMTRMSLTRKPKATEPPQHRATTGHQMRVPVRAQHQQCSRDQKLWTRPVALCDEHLLVKIFGQRDLLCDSLRHTAASMIRS